MEVLTQKQMMKYWNLNNIKKYKKVGEVEARLAKNDEEIKTIINGEEETKNRAAKGCVIVKNTNGEEYILDSVKKFNERYKGPILSDDYQSYTPTGTCFALVFTDSNISFIASWGEKMIIKPGDYLCSIYKDPDNDLYRVEHDIFLKTYKSI